MKHDDAISVYSDLFVGGGGYVAAQIPAPVPPVPPVAPVAPVAPVPPTPPVAATPPAVAFPPDPPSVYARPFGDGIGAGVGAGFSYGYSFAQPKVTTFGGQGNEDGLYQRAQTALDNHRWEEAFDGFTEVIARGGSRAEGALYWKAYALNKLGKRDEALAAIAELRKSYASSRWLEDAKVLEMETKQAAGQNVTPENESDEELKLLALNGLMQSDPDRALPLVENLLKGDQSPKLKKNAVYVIAAEQLAQGAADCWSRWRAAASIPIFRLSPFAIWRNRSGIRQTSGRCCGKFTARPATSM